MRKFRFFMVVSICWILCTAITFGEAELALKERNQDTSIDVRDIKDANYSPYLAYLKQNAKVPIQYVLDKFKKHDVVILGEMHQVKENLELIRDLIEPLYHKAGVKCFAMETLRSKNITLVNQLVTSVEYDQQLALSIFRDQGWPTWGFKEYMDVIKAVWELNNKLPPQTQKVKVVPLASDWDAYDIVSGAFTEADGKAVDNHMAQILSNEVLEKGEKALVLIGYNHSFPHYKQPRLKDGKLIGEKYARFGYILYRKYGDRIFQICLHLRHDGPEVVTKKPSSGSPILIGFMEKVFKANNNEPVGFDVENSPFACLRDKGSYYFAFQKDVVFSDIAQGYIFLKPVEQLEGMTWVNGFIGVSNFEKAKAVSLKRGWIKPGECNTPQQLDEKMKGELAEYFDKVWQIINDEFWDPNFNGVNWEDAGKRYRPKALAAKDHESFAVVVNQMLAELKTSHTYYYTKWDPDYYTLQAALISGELRESSVLDMHEQELFSSQANPHRTGIGVVTKQLNGCYYVSAVLVSSPAKRAGIVLGDWIVEVNGKPFHPIRSFENKAGQELEIIIQRGATEATQQKLKVKPVDQKERELFENDSLTHSRKLIEHKSHRFSYIRLWWLTGWKMRGAFEVGLMDNDKEGVIIDIRDGFGGSPATEYIHPFLKGGLETITRESISRKHTDRYTMAYNIPVIVLINGGSRSGKELLAYYFKKTKQGLLIGERTAGYVCGGSYKRISEESMLLYGASMLIVDGKYLECVGVEPDIEVPFDIRFAAGKDIQLERAKDEMVKLIEASQ